MIYKKVLGVDLKQYVVRTVNGALDSNKAISDLFEGVAIADHLRFFSLFEGVMLSFVHEGHNGAMKQFYFLLFSQCGFSDVQAVAGDPINGILGWTIGEF